jgi:hypothetical protein
MAPNLSKSKNNVGLIDFHSPPGQFLSFGLLRLETSSERYRLSGIVQLDLLTEDPHACMEGTFSPHLSADERLEEGSLPLVMTKEEAVLEIAVLRRVAALAGGLAVAASGVIAGAGTASAAVPAVHLVPGSSWRAELRSGGCEDEIFAPNGTFVNEFDGAAGRWSGGGATVHMDWTRRTRGLTFDGSYTLNVRGTPEYVGKFTFDGYVLKGQLVKGTRC